jgi:hypothetical protein
MFTPALEKPSSRMEVLAVDPTLLPPPPVAAVPEPAAPEPQEAKADVPVKAPAAHAKPPGAAAVVPPIGQVAKIEHPLPPVQHGETLDVAELKARLRETHAIGTMAKLSLRSQMDDLVKNFRAHHASGQAGSVASMRQPYDALVQKVIAAVQDGDPLLAKAISDSREAIWDILADPHKFESIT